MKSLRFLRMSSCAKAFIESSSAKTVANVRMNTFRLSIESPCLLSSVAPTSRLELCADLAALVGCAVNVHVKIPRLEVLVLRFGQLCAGGNGPGRVIRSLGQRNDHGTVLLRGTLVNVRCRSFDALGHHTAAHGLVGSNRDGAAPARTGFHRRYFLVACQVDFDLLPFVGGRRPITGP